MPDSVGKKFNHEILLKVLKALVFGAFVVSVLEGVIGNAVYDHAKGKLAAAYFELTHKREIAAQRAGLAALIDGDNAYQQKNLISAQLYFDSAMKDLTFSAQGGDPQAMTLLALIYRCGREPFVSRDSALYAYWQSKAEEQDETYSRHISSLCSL